METVSKKVRKFHVKGIATCYGVHTVVDVQTEAYSAQQAAFQALRRTEKNMGLEKRSLFWKNGKYSSVEV